MKITRSPSLLNGSEADILKGMYRFTVRGDVGSARKVRLLGAGAILREVIAAAELLETEFGIASEVFSATSFAELAKEAAEVERGRRFGGSLECRSHVETLLAGSAPVIAATDYVRAYPQLIAPYVEARFVALGTDGFGRSDTRAALRKFFEVDRHSVVLAALEALTRAGTIEHKILAEAAVRLGASEISPAPWTI